MNGPPVTKTRIQSIDVLRGLVMVIMAIDHTREFFHNQAMTDDPTNMATTTPILFFTRWVTHFCAPVFVFLTGASAFLSGQRKTKNELSLFLLKRGLWLIVVELVVMSFGITFDPLYHMLILQVIWAIGIGMLLLSVASRLPYPVLLAVGLTIVFGHNLLDYPEAARNGNIGVIWKLIHAPRGMLNLGGGYKVFLIYSFLPWSGLMMLGFCFGKMFTTTFDAARRGKILLCLGFGIMLLFIILRTINGYGDSAPWSKQRNVIVSMLSFLNTSKYPPSLMYSCMTLGPAMIALYIFERIGNRWTAFFNIYGRVPLFYYVLHFYMLHLLLLVLFFVSGYSWNEVFSSRSFIGFRPPEFGYSLGVVYLIWISIVLILYPLCKKYNRYKSSHRYWWLSYV